jgi:hypothetical protein
VAGVKGDVKGASLLVGTTATPHVDDGEKAGGDGPVHVTARVQLNITRLNPLDLQIEVPFASPDKVDTVVVMELASQPTTLADVPTPLLLPTVRRDTLRVFDGQLRGKTLRFGPGKTRDAYVENWTRENEFVAWPVRLNEAADFDVSITYDAPQDSAGGTYKVKIGKETLSATVKSGENLSVSLGRVRLGLGAFEIQVMPDKIAGAELMRLRSVTLILTSAK